MSRGVTAFYIVVAIILSIGILSGVGFFNAIGVQYPTSADDDVREAANALVGQEATDRSGGSVLQDFTTAGATSLSSGWQVIGNLGGILELLLLLPDALATPIERVFQLTFGLTFAFYIRGLLL